MAQQIDNGNGNGPQGSWLDWSKAMFSSPATPGILLILCTALALIAANSGIAEGYHHFLQEIVTVGSEGFGLSLTLHHWINDGLMAIFFFSIGLEIKREMLIGQLSSIRQSALPIIAAVGGMVVPAAIYAAFNMGGDGARGWGIPMATDIAFALGILSLLGKRVPVSLKVFLLALAIVDDLGAVLVIAIFYTDTISLIPLAVAIGGWIFAMGLNAMHVRSPIWYALVGIVVWVGMLESGVHATIAGVLMGFAIPVRTLYDGPTWLNAIEAALGQYRAALQTDIPESDEEIGVRQEAVHRIEQITERAQSPLIRLEHALQPLVAYLIMPVFALANAGVTISAGQLGTAFLHPVMWGVLLGLFIGKQIGVFLFSWLAVKLGIALRPQGTRWKQFYGVAILSGIGFTMSLFVTELSFTEHPELAEVAKLAVLIASLLAGVIGYIWLYLLDKRDTAAASATSPLT